MHLYERIFSLISSIIWAVTDVLKAHSFALLKASNSVFLEMDQDTPFLLHEMLIKTPRTNCIQQTSTINKSSFSFPHSFFFNKTIPNATNLSLTTVKNTNPVARHVTINRSTAQLRTQNTTFTNNPFQCNGSEKSFEMKEVNEGLLVKVDMPGVEEEDVEIRIDDSSLYFQGRGSNHWELEVNPPRAYMGTIDLSTICSNKLFDRDNVKVEIKNGVLRVFVPYIANSTTSLDFGCHRKGNTIMLKELDNTSGGLYPFQVSGAVVAYEAVVIDEHTVYVRIDMPSVGMEDFSSNVVENTVELAGDSGKESGQNDSEQRRYYGRIDFSCGCCKITDVKFEIKGGVLRMLISKENIN